MKIEFKKISSIPKSFLVSIGDMHLQGEIRRIGERLFRLEAVLKGVIPLVCDRSGEEYHQSIEENLALFVSNGIWNKQSQNDGDVFDIVEFFEGFIDFEYILQSEINSIQTQYHVKGE